MAYTYRFCFAKTGEMIYISHLDLMRLLSRASRRADLPMFVTQGFNPHFIIRLKKALKVGLASESEEGELVLAEKMDEREMLARLSRQLPEGLELKNIQLCMD